MDETKERNRRRKGMNHRTGVEERIFQRPVPNKKGGNGVVARDQGEKENERCVRGEGENGSMTSLMGEKLGRDQSTGKKRTLCPAIKRNLESAPTPIDKGTLKGEESLVKKTPDQKGERLIEEREGVGSALNEGLKKDTLQSLLETHCVRRVVVQIGNSKDPK